MFTSNIQFAKENIVLFTNYWNYPNRNLSFFPRASIEALHYQFGCCAQQFKIIEDLPCQLPGWRNRHTERCLVTKGVVFTANLRRQVYGTSLREGGRSKRDFFTLQNSKVTILLQTHLIQRVPTNGSFLSMLGRRVGLAGLSRRAFFRDVFMKFCAFIRSTTGKTKAKVLPQPVLRLEPPTVQNAKRCHDRWGGPTNTPVEVCCTIDAISIQDIYI